MLRIKNTKFLIYALSLVAGLFLLSVAPKVYAADSPGHSYACGGGNAAVEISFDIGCKGEGNPILDMLFALSRFLFSGVGIILVGAMIVTGIQHTLARDKPDATVNLVKRLVMLAAAIVLYALTFAILNYLVPGGLLI